MKRAPLLIGLAAAGGAAGFLSSRRRRDAAKGALAEATAPARHANREYDDVTLAREVETELFRPEDAPKGAVSVNAHDGVVELRGQVQRAEDVEALGVAAAKIAGVKGVTNLLHTPERPPEPAPVSTPEQVRERAER